MIVLQDQLPAKMRPKPLPGMAPLEPNGWIVQDDAFDGQMAVRDHLLLDYAELVCADAGADLGAKAEVLELVLDIIRDRPGYIVGSEKIVRPDGVRVALCGDPLVTAARLIQEDLLLHEQRNDQWTLTAAVLCFPASWTLAEKIGKGLVQIHSPVPEYDADLAKRVARLFDGIQPDRPLWRSNHLTYADASLFHPRTEASPRDGDHDGDYHRSEHQALVRLPRSGAVLFSIHTYVVALE